MSTAYFVGRDRELNLLVRASEGSDTTGGRLVAISGEPGIGKTRLMSEFARLARPTGRLVLWSQMAEDPAAPPFFAWILALRECIGAYDDTALREDLGSGASDLADMLPELRDRLEIPEGRPSPGREAAQYRVFDSVTRFLAAAARRQPLLLLFDNLHLFDPSSLALLEYYARGVRTTAVVVVCAYRDAEVGMPVAAQATLGRLSRSVSFDHIKLRGLDRNSVAELLHLYLGRPASPGTVDGIHSQSDGNPLFVCEVGTLLAARRSSSAQARTPQHPFRVPDTLRELIDARLRELPAACVRLLGTAAILGREFSVAALAAIARSNATAVLNTLERAESDGIVAAIGPAYFRFHHAVFREVLYAGHSTLRRTTLHQRAAEYLETSSAGDLVTHLTQLAHHHFEAAQLGQTEDVVNHCVRAAEGALAQRAFAEAAVQFERAIHVMELKDDPERRFELLMKLGDAQFRSAQVAVASETLLEAALLANHHQLWRRLAEALVFFQEVRAALGIGHVASVPLHEDALAHLPDGELSLRGRVLVSLAAAQRHAGRTKQARSTARQGIAVARRSNDASVLARCLALADYAFCNPMVVAERLVMARELIALAQRGSDAEAEMEALKNLLLALLDKGEMEEAYGRLAELRSLAQTERHPHYLTIAAGVETALAIMKGRWDEAIQRAMESQRSAPLQGVVGLQGRFGFQVFTIYRSRGMLGDVASIFSSIVGTNGHSALWLPGQILMHCELGQREQALASLDRMGDPGRLPRDDLYLTILIYLGEASVSLGDRRRCARLYELLLPFRGANACLAGTLVHGAVSGYLARLAAIVRRRLDALSLFQEAISMNSAMGATVALVGNQVECAAVLLASDRVDEHRRAGELLADARTAGAALGLAALLKRIDQLEARGTGKVHLSARELEVLQFLMEGASNQKIADSLFVSPNTVATHVRNILRKVGAANRTEAAAFARHHHLLPPA